MPAEGDTAPDFTLPLAHGTGEIDQFTLSDHLTEAPIVLAFFPGAFTPPCQQEMSTFQEDIRTYRDAGATLYGISVDTPFAQNAFREENGYEFGMLADADAEVVERYDVAMEFGDMGYRAAQRAVFVIDADGEITYRWIADEPTNQPDFDAIEAAVEAAA